MLQTDDAPVAEEVANAAQSIDAVREIDTPAPPPTDDDIDALLTPPGLSEADLSDFFENAAIPIHWVGSDGSILRVNQAELESGRHFADTRGLGGRCSRRGRHQAGQQEYSQCHESPQP